MSPCVSLIYISWAALLTTETIMKRRTHSRMSSAGARARLSTTRQIQRRNTIVMATRTRHTMSNAHMVARWTSMTTMMKKMMKT